MTIAAQKLEALVTTAVGRFARKVWWASRDDLRQEAHVAAAEAARTYVEGCCNEPEQYYWRAIVFALSRMLWRESAPVSGGLHRPKVQRAGLTRAAISDGMDAGDSDGVRSDGGVVLVSPDDVEALAIEAEWRANVRDRLCDLASTDAERTSVEILLEEVTAKDAAERLGCSTAAANGLATRMKSRASGDSTLYDLMLSRRR